MIETVLETLLGRLKSIVETETIVGHPVESGNATIFPVSKITFGFGVGGGDHSVQATGSKGTATGGGATIEPIAIITVQDGDVKVHKLKEKGVDLSKIIEGVPDLLKRFGKGHGKKNSESREA